MSGNKPKDLPVFVVPNAKAKERFESFTKEMTNDVVIKEHCKLQPNEMLEWVAQGVVFVQCLTDNHWHAEDWDWIAKTWNKFATLIPLQRTIVVLFHPVALDCKVIQSKVVKELEFADIKVVSYDNKKNWYFPPALRSQCEWLTQRHIDAFTKFTDFATELSQVKELWQKLLAVNGDKALKELEKQTIWPPCTLSDLVKLKPATFFTTLETNLSDINDNFKKDEDMFKNLQIPSFPLTIADEVCNEKEVDSCWKPFGFPQISDLNDLETKVEKLEKELNSCEAKFKAGNLIKDETKKKSGKAMKVNAEKPWLLRGKNENELNTNWEKERRERKAKIQAAREAKDNERRKQLQQNQYSSTMPIVDNRGLLEPVTTYAAPSTVQDNYRTGASTNPPAPGEGTQSQIDIEVIETGSGPDVPKCNLQCGRNMTLKDVVEQLKTKNNIDPADYIFYMVEDGTKLPLGSGQWSKFRIEECLGSSKEGKHVLYCRPKSK